MSGKQFGLLVKAEAVLLLHAKQLEAGVGEDVGAGAEEEGAEEVEVGNVEGYAYVLPTALLLFSQCMLYDHVHKSLHKKNKT